MTASSDQPKTRIQTQQSGAPASRPARDVSPTVYQPVASMPDASGGGANASRPRTQLDVAATQTPIYAPSRRRPTARLMVMDDGSISDGEIVRVRKEVFVIGRDQGDLKIEHDLDVSGQHAALKFHHQRGKQRWQLEDCDSTNGTFVRISRAPLADGKDLLIGSDRYRVEIQGADVVADEPVTKSSTRVFRAPVSAAGGAVELRLTSVSNPDSSFVIKQGGAMVGLDGTQCEVAVEDRLLSPVHASISWSGTSWKIEDEKSLNGVWIRINKVWLDQDAEFQLGEQRFRFYCGSKMT